MDAGPAPHPFGAGAPFPWRRASKIVANKAYAQIKTYINC
jgi:hypothetical protein